METYSQNPFGSCLDIIDLYHELPSNSSFPVNAETKKSTRATLGARGIGLHYAPVINQTRLINRRMAVHFIQLSFHQLQEAAMSNSTVNVFGIHYGMQGEGRDGGGEHALASIIHQSEV